jgi:hypothetical protein
MPEENKEKKVGVEIHGPNILHGKRARLVRGEQEVIGVLLANDSQVNSDKFAFQFVNKHGVKSISQVTKDELQNIDEYLIDY